MINQVQTNMKGKNKGQANLQKKKKKDQTQILIRVSRVTETNNLFRPKR